MNCIKKIKFQEIIIRNQITLLERRLAFQQIYTHLRSRNNKKKKRQPASNIITTMEPTNQTNEEVIDFEKLAEGDIEIKDSEITGNEEIDFDNIELDDEDEKLLELDEKIDLDAIPPEDGQGLAGEGLDDAPVVEYSDRVIKAFEASPGKFFVMDKVLW